MDINPPDEGGQEQTAAAQEDNNVQYNINNQNFGTESDLPSNSQQDPVEDDKEHLNLERPEMTGPENNQFSFTYDELCKGLAFNSFLGPCPGLANRILFNGNYSNRVKIRENTDS